MTDEFLGLRKVAEQAAVRGVKMPLDAGTVLTLLDRVETAEQAIVRVQDLHQWNRVDQYDDKRGDWVEEYCQGCHEVWPCATIRALEGDDEN